MSQLFVVFGSLVAETKDREAFFFHKKMEAVASVSLGARGCVIRVVYLASFIEIQNTGGCN